MKKLLLLITLLLTLTAPAFAQFNWERVGGDPCTLSFRQAISKLSLPREVRETAINSYINKDYEVIAVKPGAEFAEIVFGAGKVREDVYCSWTKTPGEKAAILIVIGYDNYRYEIVRFTRCSNVCWRRVELPPVPKKVQAPQPVVVVAPPVLQPPQLPLGPTFNSFSNGGTNGGMNSTVMTPSSPGPLVLPSGSINVQNGNTISNSNENVNANINENLNVNQNTNGVNVNVQQQQQQQQ